MKQLKVRAWNKLDKKFVYGLLDTGEIVLRLSFQVHFKADIEPWEQFTGRLDKTNKEIFEGDIVKEKYCDSPFIVSFRELYGSFGSNADPFLSLGPSEYLEVIGNIHENPDILKDPCLSAFEEDGIVGKESGGII